MICELCRCTLAVSKQLTTDEIVNFSCDYLKIKRSDLVSKNRKQSLVEARYMVGFVLYHNKNATETLSLAEIGTILGKRDHTTIIHGFRALRNWCETNEGFRNRFYDLNLHLFEHLNYIDFYVRPKDKTSN